MARELQARVLEVLAKSTGRRVYDGPTPAWLLRPGREECGPLWRTVRAMYRELSDGLELPDEMPVREWREIDGVIGGRGTPWRLVEVDESQHFNPHRAVTLKRYPKNAPLAFPIDVWLAASQERSAVRGGGWAKPKPPLFPMEGGRHRQWAFRDALADLLPPLHEYAPTLRIADFEVEPWIWDARGATVRLGQLTEERLATGAPWRTATAPPGEQRP